MYTPLQRQTFTSLLTCVYWYVDIYPLLNTQVPNTSTSQEVIPTLAKSSLEALISFHVLFSRYIQAEKNSSNGRSDAKNIGI